MTKADRIIRELVDALDYIQREATMQNDGAIDRIRGAAEQAIANADRQRVRNADGYLVTR